MYDTLESAFEDGYKTGLDWTESWVPGGPWFFYADIEDNFAFKTKARFSQDCNKAWLAGWKKGVDSAKKPV